MPSLHKIISYWENPYKNSQHEIHKLIKRELARHNGQVRLDQIETIQDINTKSIQRLFDVKEDCLFEWKSDIVNIKVLEKRLGKTPSPELVDIFENSRSVENRSNFPNLVYSNRQHLQKEDDANPVFGFDILIRPTTSFNEKNPAHKINIGRTQLILFIHLHPQKNSQSFDPKKTLIRIGAGELAGRMGIPQILARTLADQLDIYNRLLRNNELERLTQSILGTYQSTIHRAITASKTYRSIFAR